MKNMVVLQKLKDGSIYCRQITELGKRYSEDALYDDSATVSEGYWEKGGTVLLEELGEILDKEI